MQTATFIGNGNMALSIAKGLRGKYHIEVVGREMEKLEAFEKDLGVHIDKSGRDQTVAGVDCFLSGESRIVWSDISDDSVFDTDVTDKKCSPSAINDVAVLNEEVCRVVPAVGGVDHPAVVEHQVGR